MKEIIISLMAFIIVVLFLIVLIIHLIRTFGFARVQVTKVTKDSNEEGIRFYRPAPYLLITRSIETTGPTLKHTLLYLPDKSQEYAIRVTPGIGSVTANATLDGGWNLVGFDRTIDTKIPETITAISGIEPISPATAKAPEKKETLEIGLYKIAYNQEGEIDYLTPIPTRIL